MCYRRRFLRLFSFFFISCLRKVKVLRNSNTWSSAPCFPMMASQRWKEYFRLFEEIWLENLIVVYSVLIERHDDLAEKRIKSSCGIIILQRNCVFIHPITTFVIIFLFFFLPNRHAVLYLSRRQSKFLFGINLETPTYYIHEVPTSHQESRL